MRKLIVVVVLLLGGFIAYRSVQGSAKTATAEQQNWPSVHPMRETMIESTVATGTIKSKTGAEVKVGSQLSGVVSRLFVSVGDVVTKGQLLAQLDDMALRARANTLKAELDAAKAEYDYAVAEMQRYEKLGPNIARLQLDNSRRNVAVREANIEQSKARLADANIQLGYVRLVAPISGTIASVSTYEGETVAASFAAPTFVTIVDLSRLEIQAYVDETDIGKVHAGQAVSFRVDAYSGQELQGVVRAIYPKAQLVNNVVNYIVIIDITDRKGLLLRPEMTTHVTFILDKKDNVVSLPRSAVLREGGQNYVLLKTPTGWTRDPVKTGMHTPQRVEITSDLKGSDEVLADVQRWTETEKEK